MKCRGGENKVEWGFDGSVSLGGAIFYEEVSVQFVHKLPGGTHVFYVISKCGKVQEGKVEFRIR